MLQGWYDLNECAFCILLTLDTVFRFELEGGGVVLAILPVVFHVQLSLAILAALYPL
jgi:hypothetical protein